MKDFNPGDTVKKEVFRAVLERMQSTNMEKASAPKEEDTVSYGNIEEELNIPYMNRDEVPLGMDIFKPAAEAGTELPVVVTIHGGGLVMGDRKISRPFGRYLASKGYLVFSIEYRLAPRANVCMQLDDVCAGLDLVGRRLVDYDVDFRRIFIAAESAGAYLALYVTAMKGSKKLQEAIGYEPTHVSFKAIGLMSGMLYTNNKGFTGKMFAQQIYGEKQADENFLQYMDPEHPEIINNIPPAYLITSRGDVLNHYSLKMNEALKKAGKPCHLLYCGDKDLSHAFTTLQTEDPRSLEAIDKMLAWFETQAAANADKAENEAALRTKRERYEASRTAGRRNNQRISQYIRECTAMYPERYSAPAILDCAGTYTYAQMFEQWDRYARVFTALGITEENRSRVALVGTISAEPIFAFYGLNTVGACVSMFSYPNLLPGGQWRTMVEKEHITDMVISDIMVTPQMWAELNKAKAELGLRNIILLHTRMGGPCLGYAEMLFNEFNYNALKRIPGIMFMDQLAEKYKDTEIRPAKKSGTHLAVICHTSGTTKGTRKPLPYTDRTVNGIAALSCTLPLLTADDCAQSTQRLLIPFDFSSAMSFNGNVNCTFAQGGSLVLTFFGFIHPKFVYAFRYYGIESAFTSGFMLEKWMQMPALEPDAFASVKTFGFGGSYIPAAKMEKYTKFLKAHGFKGNIYRGYGMSELGAVNILAPKDSDEDILGYPSDAEAFRIQDETDGQFYKPTEGPRTGILYGTSPSMCLNVLDGETLFELTEIDGKQFLCTNDAVRVNEDGSLSYAGRANRFFANNDGVRFEAGQAETLLSAEPAVNTCAFVPVLDKRIHDTVPVLYAIPARKGPGAAGEILAAIENVFVKGERLRGSVLPSQFVLVDSIPCNSNGKVDVFRITRSRLQGSAYNIIPVKNGETVTALRCEPAAQLTSYTGGTLPEGMGRDSGFRVFDMFNRPSGMVHMKQVRGMISDTRDAMKEKRSEQKQKILSALPRPTAGKPKVPDRLKDTMMTMNGFMYNQDLIDHDFED